MGLGSSIGKAFNAITGATDAAQTNWKYQKQAMQNAHQWEVQDLTKAGLNPVYSANSQGASTGGASPGMQAGGTGFMNSAMTALTESAKMLQQQKKINAEVNNIDADTTGREINNAWKDPLNQSLIDQRTATANANNAEASLRDKKMELMNSNMMLNATKANLNKMSEVLGESTARKMEDEIDKLQMENKQLEKQYGLESDQIAMEQAYLNSKLGKTFHYIGRGFNDVKGIAQSAAGIYGALQASKAIKNHQGIELQKLGQGERRLEQGERRLNQSRNYTDYTLHPNGHVTKHDRFYR